MRKGVFAVLMVLGGCWKSTSDAEPARPVEQSAVQSSGAADVPTPALGGTTYGGGTPQTGSGSASIRPACTSDATHCCLGDGQVVPTSSCDPDRGRGQERGGGGFCVETNCRCLPPDALIATPRGDIAIATLHLGDLVWTMDEHGRRLAAPIITLSSTPFTGDHPVHEVTLNDGRVFRASAGHPLVERTLVGGLRVGGHLDGSTVSTIRTRMIRGHTWDLLPAGPTGTYWSDGVQLGSTLAVTHMK
jgi:hypothetical protein